MTTADYNSFADLDIEIGLIVDVKEFPRARNPSYKVTINFGGDKELGSSAQITNYSMDELMGKQVVCITNLPERNIAGYKSQVLVLGVQNEKGETILLQPDVPVAEGQRIF